MTEAEFLAALRKLPLHPGATSLADDVARLDGLVLTTDTIVEGVHYLTDDAPADIAWKLVAVNLSDLAAKGATPEGVLLNYPLAPSAGAGFASRKPEKTPPRSTAATLPSGSAVNGLVARTTLDPLLHAQPGTLPAGWDGEFVAGLAQALKAFACPLFGGDTVSLPVGAPRVITLTAIGRVSTVPARTGARAGDTLYVTGTIGDAGAGLRIARGEPGPAALLAAYRRPQPRLAEGGILAPLVHAMMDVSDGLLIDAARMTEASGLALTIDLAAVPLSPAYRAFAGEDRAARLAAATAGDDYQLLFAAPAALALPIPATPVGTFAVGTGIALTDDETPVELPGSLGFTHRV